MKNRYVYLVDSNNRIIEKHYFIDSTQRWEFSKGYGWIVVADHTGLPSEEWLKNNPKPR